MKAPGLRGGGRSKPKSPSEPEFSGWLGSSRPQPGPPSRIVLGSGRPQPPQVRKLLVSMRIRFSLAVLGLLTGAALGAAALPERPNSPGRLGDLTPSRRRAIEVNLKVFDGLPKAERLAILRLDAELAGLEAGERQDLLDAMRRYRLGLASLPPARRIAIKGVEDPEKKAQQMAKALGKAAPTGGGSNRLGAEERLAIGLQISTLCQESLLVSASRALAWFDLPEAARASIAANRDPRAAFRRAVTRAGKLPEIIDLVVARLGMGDVAATRRPNFRAALRRRIEGGPRPPALELNALKLAELEFIRRNVSDPVEPEALAAFEATLPTWTRESFDPLPPDAATLRLSLIYRIAEPIDDDRPGARSAPR